MTEREHFEATCLLREMIPCKYGEYTPTAHLESIQILDELSWKALEFIQKAVKINEFLKGHGRQ